MSTPVLTSTFFLVLLLLIGLFFFIRASVKDRTQQVGLVSSQPEADLLTLFQQYFTQRAYRVVSVDPDQKQVQFEGFVRPSVFLAAFLTVLAAVGVLCLALVLSLLLPRFSAILLSLVFLSPLAGIFYWRNAARPEQVLLTVETIGESPTDGQTKVRISAHRDEIAELKRNLQLELTDS
jgi:hypothetical protein